MDPDFATAQELDSTYIMQTFARKPVMLTQGRGMQVQDSAGHSYLDFIAGIGVDSLGHCHPVVVDAIKAQAERLIHVSNYYYIEKRGELAKLLSVLLNTRVGKDAQAPWQSFFANSGAEANECAVKLARRYARRFGNGGQQVITLDRSFHGRTFTMLAATAQPAKQEAFQPLPPGFLHVPMNDLAALEQTYIQHNGDICALMIEPVQGEAGVYPWDAGVLQEVAAFAREHGLLLVCDEVQSGIFRCGDYPFAFQNLGITPDIVSMAKGIGSGFPLGVCAARSGVAAAFDPGDHGSTFGGSNLAVAVALAVLTELSQGGYASRVSELGGHLAEGLRGVDGVTEVRGLGLMRGAQLEAGIDAHKVVLAGLEAGFLLNATGPGTLRFLPPLIVEKTDIDTLLAALPALLEAARA